MAKQKIQGPYRVINIGVNDPVYEVVGSLDSHGNYEELRPRKTYLNRQSAYGMCARLNRRHQEQLNPDEWD